MAEPGALIDIPSVPNLRDVGGWATGDGGGVRTGVLYRSTALHGLAGDDMAAFERLGVRVVFDLRTADERAAMPDRLPAGAHAVVCDVLRDSQDTAPAQLGDLLNDPELAKEMLADGRARTLFENAYREIVSLPSALSAFRDLYTGLLADGDRPALVHCTTGKDRSGWATAAALTFAGVAPADVEAEYLLTNRYLLPALKPFFDHFRAIGGDPELLRPILGVEAIYLQTAFDEMRSRFGSIEGYFAEGLGLDDGERRELREALVAP